MILRTGQIRIIGTGTWDPRPRVRWFLCGALLAAFALAAANARGKDDVAPLPACRSVDSVWARYYLDHYRQGDRNNPRMDEAIDEALSSLPPGVPDSASLRRLTCRFSTDFATLVLYDRLWSDPECRRYRQWCAQVARPMEVRGPAYTRLDRFNNPATETSLNRSSVEFLVVPGLFYRTVPESNADMAIQRRALEKEGWRTHLIRIPENGSVECNARVVASTVQRFGRQGTDVVLISASKGGPETAMALGTLLAPEETRHVRAWLNVCGLLKGTQLSDEAASKPLGARLGLRLLAGTGDLTGLLSLTTGRSRRRYQQVTLPRHILVVNYVAVPLSCHIRQETEMGYRKLKSFGPNDGRGLLIDQFMPGTPVVTEFGLDHYFRSRVVQNKTMAVVDALLHYEREVWTGPGQWMATDQR